LPAECSGNVWLAWSGRAFSKLAGRRFRRPNLTQLPQSLRLWHRHRLWQGLPTLPPPRPQVSRRREGPETCGRLPVRSQETRAPQLPVRVREARAQPLNQLSCRV
jgi:hypothetical protein